MKNIKKFFSRNIFPFFIKILPIQKNLIVFSSFGGVIILEIQELFQREFTKKI